MKASRIILLAVLLLGMASMGAAEWENASSLPEERYGLGTSVLDGSLYAVGGQDADFDPRDTVFRYDPGSDSWSTVASLPDERRGLGTSVLDGNLYAVGGRDADGDQRDTVFRYDAGSDSWNTVAPLPEERWALGTSVLDGEMYAVGGRDADNNPRDTVFRYDAGSDSWSTVASLTGERYALGTSVLDGSLYAVGGLDADFDQRDTVFRYDPGSDSWSTVASLPDERGRLGTSVLDGNLYAVGGSDADGDQRDTVFRYDAGSDSWSSVASLPEERSSLGTSVLDGEMYAVGGRDANADARDTVFRVSFNQPPVFESVSVNPDPPVIDESHDLSFDVSDDSEIIQVELEWFRDGTIQENQVNDYSSPSVQDTVNDFYTPTEQGQHTIYYTATDNEGASTTETLEYTQIEEDPATSWVEIVNPLNNAEFSASETEEDLNDDIEFENQLNPTDLEEDLTFTGVVTSPSGDTWTAFDNENRQTPTGSSISFSGIADAYQMVKDNDIGFDTEQNFGQYEYQIYWKEGHDQNVDENDFEYTDGPNTFTVEEAADRPEITWNSPQNNENFVIDKFESTLTSSDSVTSQRETFFNQPLNGDTYVIQQGETLDFNVIYSSRTSAFDATEDIELQIDNELVGAIGPDIIQISDGALSDGESHTFTFDGNEHTIEVVSRDRDVTPSTVDVLIDGEQQTFQDGEKISIDEFDPNYSGDGNTDQGWVVTVVSTTVFDPYHDQQTINVDEGLTGGNYDLRLEEYPNNEFSDTINIDVEEETLADVGFEYDLNIDEDEASTGIEFREGTDAFTEIFTDTVTSSGLLNHEETGLGLGEYEYYAFADTESYNVQSETRSFTVTDEPLVNEVGISLLNPTDGQVFNVNEGETQEVQVEASIDTTDYDASDELTLNWILDGTTDATQTINGDQQVDESIIFGLGEGSYSWSVEVIDPDSQTFSSETRSFEISEDDTTVNFNILNPSQGEQFLLNEEVLLSSNVESNVDGSKYHVVEDSTGSTVFESEETYLTSFGVYESSRNETFVEGDYSYYNRFEVDGSSSSFESSSVDFSVLDIDSPEIDLVNPTDGSQIVSNGSESFTVDFEFTASAEKTGSIELLVKEPGNESFELVESFNYNTENELETFEASQLFEGIEYPNEVNSILESSEYEWKVTFQNEEFQIDYETSPSSWTFVEEEITAASGIVDRVLDFLRGYWEAFMDGTSTTGKAFIGLTLMLLVGGLGFAAAGSIGAGFGMAAMFLVNTLVGLFPGWIVLALVIGGLAYVLIMRGD